MILPAEEVRRDPHPPVALHDRAIDDLRFIRETMVRSSAFTAISGVGVAAMGGVAIAAFWLARGGTPAEWVRTWIVAAILGFAIAVTATIRKARKVGEPLAHGPGRRLILGSAPALLVGGVLTWPLLDTGRVELLPAVWILLYGTAVTSGGAFSVRPVPLMGLVFLALGMGSLFLPPGYENATMLVAFGGVHVVFGAWIARRHGG
ncbi:MAG: hypothetical protein RQ745_02690 [Longimicrobiales bacterium]|nr:hypothetical protein [Longimicrobiales bacterium]